ncbi:MAG TPA: L-histidine N(alpha)-methyltransferase [Acidobacteriaceae bacterium]|nr:L-histidine N(alpha)-methyltransferase [Acidobacteriaceae bacterium]
MSQSAILHESQTQHDGVALDSTQHAVAEEARRGLSVSPKSLAPWIFYDEAGSHLFEEITALPEYYLTRAEREIFRTHAQEIVDSLDGNLTIAELGAGTASKTGILLRALTQRQAVTVYQPIDISSTALDEARAQLESAIPKLNVRACVANYVTDVYRIERAPGTRVLALYIGSSIGNFSSAEARAILAGLRAQLRPGDALLLGTDLAPYPADAAHPAKTVSALLAAYNDKQGVTAAFNLNLLSRLNRDLGADFHPQQFAHRALWNHTQSRIEMHLKSLVPQRVTIPANSAGPAMHVNFFAGETIHTENSYKFTPATISTLLAKSGFQPKRSFTDAEGLFGVTLATVI